LRADGNINAVGWRPSISILSKRAKNSGTGTVRDVWFFVGPSTRPV
jgi:hypothetical protein